MLIQVWLETENLSIASSFVLAAAAAAIKQIHYADVITHGAPGEKDGTGLLSTS